MGRDDPAAAHRDRRPPHRRRGAESAPHRRLGLELRLGGARGRGDRRGGHPARRAADRPDRTRLRAGCPVRLGVQSERAYGAALVDGIRRAGFFPVSLVRVRDVASANQEGGDALATDLAAIAITRYGDGRVYAMATSEGRTAGRRRARRRPAGRRHTHPDLAVVAAAWHRRTRRRLAASGRRARRAALLCGVVRGGLHTASARDGRGRGLHAAHPAARRGGGAAARRPGRGGHRPGPGRHLGAAEHRARRRARPPSTHRRRRAPRTLRRRVPRERPRSRHARPRRTRRPAHRLGVRGRRLVRSRPTDGRQSPPRRPGAQGRVGTGRRVGGPGRAGRPRDDRTAASADRVPPGDPRGGPREPPGDGRAPRDPPRPVAEGRRRAGAPGAVRRSDRLHRRGRHRRGLGDRHVAELR